MKLQLMESMSKTGLEKRFYIEDFLNQSSVSNKEQTRIKNIIIKWSGALYQTGLTRLELATSAVTGRCSNQLNYNPMLVYL